MDLAAASPRPRVDTRYRRWTPSIQSREKSRRDTHGREDHRRGASDAPPVHKEKERKQGDMTKDHRLYHRRQAAAATKTIAVEVIATVDDKGNVVGQETKTQTGSKPTLGVAVGTPPAIVPAVPVVVAPSAPAVVNAVPSPAAPSAAPGTVNVQNEIPPAPASLPVPPAVPVPAVPTLPQVPAVPAVPTVALPSVPSVPPFPSDLNVPAYPYGSSVPAVVAQFSSTPVVSSPAPTSSGASSAISASSFPIGSNSTIISTSLSSTSSRASASSAFSSKSESDSVSVHAYNTHSSSSHSETRSSQFSSAATSTSAVGTTFYGGMGGGAATNTAADPALATAGSGGGSPGSTTPLPTPQVVGSVVGSLAGAALILAIILLLLQRHKRQRRGALQLTNDETTERSSPPMAQDLSKANRIPSAFLNRFSGMSRSTADTSTSGEERSFQRVSGRKLPSAFSEGMTSEQFSRGQTLSGSSFYTEDQGTYGGPGFSKELGKELSATPIAAGMMNIRPGPARTPVIRHPDEDNVNPFDDPAPFPRSGSHLSPPQSPNPEAPRNTLGRSLQSQDGSRSSKFTENV
jgi:hypothetical protein